MRIVLTADARISDVISKIFHQCLHTTGEFGLVLYHVVYSLFFGKLLNNDIHIFIDFDNFTLILNRDNLGLFNFGIIFNDFKNIGKEKQVKQETPAEPETEPAAASSETTETEEVKE